MESGPYNHWPASWVDDFLAM